MNRWTLPGAAALILASSLAVAQTPAVPSATPHIDQREANQQQRIANGVQSGELNARETAKLQSRESKIAATEAAAKADGKVTKSERATLHRKEDHASRAIYRQKHDAQKAR